jgi:hypothetical protein
MKKIKQTTHCKLVYDALRSGEQDFYTIKELVKTTGSSYHQVTVSLSNLRHYRAADVVIQMGIGYWFETHETDQRNWTHDERTPESKRRKPRKLSNSVLMNKQITK